MPLDRRLAVAVLIALSACIVASGDAVYPLDPDASPEQAAQRAAASYGGALAVEDVRIGTGRVAQATRKVTVELAFSDSGGSASAPGYGRARFLILEPSPVAAIRTNDLVLRQLWAGIAGMREHGERRIFVRLGCRLARDSTCLVIGEQLEYINVPVHIPLMVAATVVKVCAPRYRLRRSYSLPGPVKTDRLEERSCR